MISGQFLQVRCHPTCVGLRRFAIQVTSQGVNPCPYAIVSCFAVPRLAVAFVRGRVFRPFHFHGNAIVRVCFSNVQPLSSYRPVAVCHVVMQVRITRRAVESHHFPHLVIRPSPVFGSFKAFSFRFFSFDHLVNCQSLSEFSSPQ